MSWLESNFCLYLTENWPSNVKFRYKFSIWLQSFAKQLSGWLPTIYFCAVQGLIYSEKPEQITSNSPPQPSTLGTGFPSLVWHICYWEDGLLGLVWRDYLPDVTNVGLYTNRSTIGKLSRKLFILQHDHFNHSFKTVWRLPVTRRFLSKLNHH